MIAGAGSSSAYVCVVERCVVRCGGGLLKGHWVEARRRLPILEMCLRAAAATWRARIGGGHVLDTRESRLDADLQSQ